MNRPGVPTKTISLEFEAYEKLKAAKRTPDESFSQVVLRARWPEETVRAGELLRRRRTEGALLPEEGLARIDELKRFVEPPEDKRRTAGPSKRPS